MGYGDTSHKRIPDMTCSNFIGSKNNDGLQLNIFLDSDTIWNPLRNIPVSHHKILSTLPKVISYVAEMTSVKFN